MFIPLYIVIGFQPSKILNISEYRYIYIYKDVYIYIYNYIHIYRFQPSKMVPEFFHPQDVATVNQSTSAP